MGNWIPSWAKGWFYSEDIESKDSYGDKNEHGENCELYVGEVVNQDDGSNDESWDTSEEDSQADGGDVEVASSSGVSAENDGGNDELANLSEVSAENDDIDGSGHRSGASGEDDSGNEELGNNSGGSAEDDGGNEERGNNSGRSAEDDGGNEERGNNSGGSAEDDGGNEQRRNNSGGSAEDNGGNEERGNNSGGSATAEDGGGNEEHRNSLDVPACGYESNHEREQNCGPDVENDGRNQRHADNNATRGSDWKKNETVFNISIQSNSGTVVIGDKPTVNIAPSQAVMSSHGQNEETTKKCQPCKSCLPELQLVNLPPDVKSLDPSTIGTGGLPGNNNEEIVRGNRKPRRKRREKEKISKAEVPAIIAKSESMRECRENGNWKEFDSAMESLIKTFKRDEDNKDKLYLLKYEEAAGFYARNEIVRSLNEACEVGRTIPKDNEAQKWVYVRILLLISDIYRRQKKFGKTEKVLEEIRDFLGVQFSHPVLQGEFHLAKARYLLDCTQKHSLPSCDVINQTLNKAEEVINILEKSKQKEWKKMKRKILLTRVKVLLKIDRNEGNLETISSRLTALLHEIETHFWDGISRVTQVEFQTLKSEYFKAEGNLCQALEYAKLGHEMAKNCGFKVEEENLQRRINEMQCSQDIKNSHLPDRGLIDQFRNMTTTDSGNLESNANVVSDCGIFSPDESDWEMSERDGATSFLDEQAEDSDDLWHEVQLPQEDKKKEGRKHDGINCQDEDKEKGRECGEDRRCGNGFQQQPNGRSDCQMSENGQNESYEAVPDGNGTERNCVLREHRKKSQGACALDVRDNQKLTEREQTRLALRLASYWRNLLGLLNIDSEDEQNISSSLNLYPSSLSKTKAVLHIYNKRIDFSRKKLASLIEEDLRLPDEAAAIVTGAYQRILIAGERPIPPVRNHYTDVTADGDTRSECAPHLPDEETLTQREQTRLALRLGSCWIELLGLLDMEHEVQQDISASVNLYPDLPSKGKEVLRRYNKRKNFSRRELSMLVEQDLKFLEEAEAILTGGYR